MIMTQKFTKKDVENVFRQYLAAQGYKMESLSVLISYSEFDNITCTVSETQPTKTFIVPVGHLTEKEAKKNLQEMMKSYREEITITEDKDIDYIIPQSIEREKSNEN